MPNLCLFYLLINIGTRSEEDAPRPERGRSNRERARGDSRRAQRGVSPSFVLPASIGNSYNFNYRGQIFVTTAQTLTKEPSLLAQLVAPGAQVRRDSHDRIFIDRDPTHFRWILNYLRFNRVYYLQ